MGMLVLIVMASTIACSKDDYEEEEPTYIPPHVEGKLNGMPIKVWEQDVLANRSDVQFPFVGTGCDKRLAFNWKLRLISNRDSVVFLVMHLDDLRESNEKIHYPNLTPSSCHIEVWNLQSNETTFYYPIPRIPIHVKWETFTASAKTKVEKHRDLTFTYRPHELPGIDGKVEGVLMADKPHNTIFDINLTFKYYKDYY